MSDDTETTDTVTCDARNPPSLNPNNGEVSNGPPITDFDDYCLGILVTALDSIDESVTMQHLGFGLEFQDTLSAALTRGQSQPSVYSRSPKRTVSSFQSWYFLKGGSAIDDTMRMTWSSLKEKGGMLTLNTSRHRTGHGPCIRAQCQFKALMFGTGYGSDIKWIRSRGLNEHTCLLDPNGALSTQTHREYSGFTRSIVLGAVLLPPAFCDPDSCP
ncbi:hypothetical protein EDC04DRAFT_3027609 [Pisolithus marmoratus]|nr:hypothetical protein EDC04DRAFT_3027609 [Pisolithus marmoratus]